MTRPCKGAQLAQSNPQALACFSLIILTMAVLPIAQSSDKGDFTMNTTSLLDSADVIFKSRQYEKSREIYIQALNQAVADKDISTQAEANAMIARAFLILGQKDEGRNWLANARAACDVSMPLAWSRYLGVLGRFQWQDQELDKATSTFKEMYAFCSEKGLHERAIDAAHMVAITGNADDKIEWSLKGISEAESGSVYSWLGPLWNNLGANYEEMGRFSEALDAYLKAREYHYKYGDDKNKLVADWAIGHTYRLLRNSAEAEKWLQPLLEWCRRLQDVEFEGLTFRELGEIEYSKGEYKSSQMYLLEAADLLKKADMPSWDPMGYQAIEDKIRELKEK